MQPDRFPNSEALPEAITPFSQLSARLAAAYQALAPRVTERGNELNQKHAARRRELAEKERLRVASARCCSSCPVAWLPTTGSLSRSAMTVMRSH